MKPKREYRDSPLIGMKYVRGSYGLAHDMTTGKWTVRFFGRAVFLLKGRPKPECLTKYGLAVCLRKEPHPILFESVHEYNTFEEAEHALKELNAGARVKKKYGR